MATLHLILDEHDKMLKISNVKGVHSITFHLDDFMFSDEEIINNAQAAAMMLLSAVQEERAVEEAEAN